MKFAKVIAIGITAVFLNACSSGGSSDNDNDSNLDAASDAQYRVTFTSVWDDIKFPTNFPSNAHFSGLVGATHDDSISFWDGGVAASSGVQQVAESGGKSAFMVEIAAEQDKGSADVLLDGGGIANSPTEVSYEFSINQKFSLVTLISMVAPSPDWFVGVHDLDLYDEMDGDWIDSITVNLEVYDAGTDSGMSFKSNNAAEATPENIALLTSNAADADFASGIQRATMESVGTFKFERIQ